MILDKIVVSNFRQFRGTHEVEFAQGDQNVTIIIGDNGEGKTGLFRAMMFGLFGVTKISQDDKEKDIHLVNIKEINISEGSPVEATVSVKFRENSYDYTITRRIQAFKRNEKIVERETDVRLVCYDRRYGIDKEITDSNEIERTVNSIFVESIREFFFFDAEKIDMLNHSQNQTKTIVKDGIIKVLQIDLVEKAVNLLAKKLNKMDRSISSRSKNIKLKQKEQELDEVQKNLGNLQDDIAKYREEENELYLQLSSLSEKIGENASIRDLQDKIDDKKGLVYQKYEYIKDIIRTVVTTDFKNFHQVLLKNELTVLDQNISLKLKDEKSFIPKQLIQSTLERNECFMCRSNIEHNHELIDELKNAISSTDSRDSINLMLLITYTISDFDIANNSMLENLNTNLKKIENIKSEALRIEQDISKLEDDKRERASNIPNIEQLQKSKSKIEEDQLEIKVKSSTTATEINKVSNKITEIKEELSKLRENETGLEIEIKRRNVVENLLTSLSTLSEDYCNEMRKKLIKRATSIFKDLIDEKDRNIFQEIHINEKYEVEVKGWDNHNITQDISQGQRQMVSLSLIAALSTLAAGDQHKIDFPLFMDTPFGRISGDNRDSLIMKMPDFTSQWILLLTDTELTATEEAKFKESDKLGLAYELQQVSDFETVITKKDVNDQLGRRGY